MVDVFEQVEEELRSERWARIARTWLPWVGGALALALVAALAWWAFDSWQTSRAEKAAVAYDRGMQALGADNAAGAQAAFTEASEMGGAYEALALQQLAGLAVTDNRIPEAIALFDRAADVSNAPAIHDAAALKAAFLAMDNGASLADIEGRLAPLTEEGRPFRAAAQEALGFARLQNGQAAQAREVFVLLSLGQDATEGMRQRAQAAIDAIDNGTAAGLVGIVAAQRALPPQPAPGSAAPGAAPQAAPAQAAPAPAEAAPAQ